MSDHASRSHTPMNLTGWILIAAGAVGLLTSLVGILLIFYKPPPAEVLAHSVSKLYLHDTYYVISHPVYAAWPLVLSMVLSIAIGVLGYMHTEHFIRRMMPIEGSSTNRESPHDA